MRELAPRKGCPGWPFRRPKLQGGKQLCDPAYRALPKRTRFDIGSAVRPLYVTPFREGLALKPVSAVLGIVLGVLCAGSPGEYRPKFSPPARRPTDGRRRCRHRQSARFAGGRAGSMHGLWDLPAGNSRRPIRFATEIARVVDDGDNLHVLPIVTRGPVENVEALLYLKGVDAAIINSDALDQFKTLVPNIRQRITLYPQPVSLRTAHLRPSGNQIPGRPPGEKIHFNTPGTAAAYSGPLIFERLKLDVAKTFIPHQVALQQMRSGQGDMAAACSSPPSRSTCLHIQGGTPDSVPASPLRGFRVLPAVHPDLSDYPDIIPQGREVETIAVPTILAAFNWPKGSDATSGSLD